MAQVSVIIPSYNHGRFLEQRIESVLAQSYQDFEVIMLDDASTDDSSKILERYRIHPKVVCIETNTVNSGSTFQQWARGLARAKGNYVWIAESDDFAAPDFLKEVVARLEQGLDLAYCRSVVVDESGTIHKDYYWADAVDRERWISDHRNEGINEIRDFLAYQNTISNASACVFRRDRFKMPTEILTMKYCGDWLFWICFLENANLGFVSRPLNFHRKHSQSTRVLKDFKSEIARLREYWRVIKKARLIAGKGRLKRQEVFRYKWIFEEMFRKRNTLGLRGTFESLPVRFAPYYIFFFLKKSTRKLMTG